MVASRRFKPGELITSTLKDSDKALIILNTPMMKKDTLEAIWSSCSWHICADGGANRLHDMWRPGEEAQKEKYLPELIHGDLDSLNPDVRSYYASLGVAVTRDPDQYSTDFGKAIKQIRAYSLDQETSTTALRCNTNSSSFDASDAYEKDGSRPSSFGVIKSILVFGSISGRVDQGIGLLHEMGRESERHPDITLYLISESSVTFLLLPNVENIIEIKLDEGIFTPNVGILPIYGRSSITTKGLEWDVKDWETEMGGMLSTSNHVFENEVRVWTTNRVLFTVELKGVY